MLQECLEEGAVKPHMETRILKPFELGAILTLQEICLAALPDDQDLVIPKTKEAFEGILTSPESEMVGIWSNGELVSQAIMLFPNIDEGHQETLCLLEGQHDIQDLTTLGGVLVSPDHQGQGLMKTLVNSWKSYAYQQGRSVATAMIADHNVASMAGFLANGLTIVDVAVDPFDDAVVYLAKGGLEQSASPSFRTAVESNLVVCPKWGVEDRKALFEEGHSGISLVRHESGAYSSSLIMHL